MVPLKLGDFDGHFKRIWTTGSASHCLDGTGRSGGPSFRLGKLRWENHRVLADLYVVRICKNDWHFSPWISIPWFHVQFVSVFGCFWWSMTWPSKMTRTCGLAQGFAWKKCFQKTLGAPVRSSELAGLILCIRKLDDGTIFNRKALYLMGFNGI